MPYSTSHLGGDAECQKSLGACDSSGGVVHIHAAACS